MKIFGTVLPFIGFRTRFYDGVDGLPTVFKDFIEDLVFILPDEYVIEDVDLVVLESFSFGWFGKYVNIVYGVTPYFNWEK